MAGYFFVDITSDKPHRFIRTRSIPQSLIREIVSTSKGFNPHNIIFIMTTSTKLTRDQFDQLLVNHFENEFQDMELGIEQLQMMTGGGLKSWLKKAAKKVGQLYDKYLGNNNGKFEFDDYKDELITVIGILVGGSSAGGRKNR